MPDSASEQGVGGSLIKSRKDEMGTDLKHELGSRGEGIKRTILQEDHHR